MSSNHDDNEPVPWLQQLLDNPFLLLFSTEANNAAPSCTGMPSASMRSRQVRSAASSASVAHR